MEKEVLSIFEQFGSATGLGVMIFLILKYFMTHSFTQALNQNNELVDYLMKTNTQLFETNKQMLETNKQISEENRKALEKHGQVINALIAEMRKANHNI